MRIIYTTDLHGLKWKYERILEIARDFKAELIINGGDLLPKTGNLFSQGKYITEFLDLYFKKVNDHGIYYLCYLCNDDLSIFDEKFNNVCNKYSSIFNIAQSKIKICEFEFIGMNWVVDYPFRLKDRCRIDTKDYIFQEQFGTGLLSTTKGWKEIKDWFTYAKSLPSIEDELEDLVKPKRMEKSIYVIHMPPYKLGLDKCSNGAEVGSKAIFNFLEQNQPLISLHGHIHESPDCSGKWYAKIGKTICIQPGQLNSLIYVTIDLKNMHFNRYIDSP